MQRSVLMLTATNTFHQQTSTLDKLSRSQTMNDTHRTGIKLKLQNRVHLQYAKDTDTSHRMELAI